MTLRAVTKRKRTPRPVTCPACGGRTEPQAVVVHNLHGPDTNGISYRRVPCDACRSTGKVQPKLAVACCCSAKDVTPCDNCAPQPRGLHVCTNPDFEDWDYAARVSL